MASYITVDMGTTNTRVGLMENGKLRSVLHRPMGAGNSNREALIAMLRASLSSILSDNQKDTTDISCILASGMITSEKGILPLEHIAAPSGMAEWRLSAPERLLPELSPIPFVFIRGVKLTDENGRVLDVMRGEETELAGIYRPEHSVYLLPGSHTKIIQTNDAGEIISFSSTLSGEMLSALSKGTILSASVDLEQADFDPDYLLMGYDACAARGLNHALMQVRILHTQGQRSQQESYSFFLGAVLWGDVAELRRVADAEVLIGGKRQMRLPLACLLNNRTSIRPTVLTDREVEESVFRGAVKIFEYV